MRKFSKGRFGLLLVCVAVALPFSCRDFSDDTAANPGGKAPVDRAEQAGDTATAGLNGQLRGGAGGRADTDHKPVGGDAGRGHDGGAGGHASVGGNMAGVGGELSLEPSSFDQLALWLEASDSACQLDAEDRVTSWLDASSNDNDAEARAQFQRPKYVDDVVNGHGVLRFVPVVGAGNHEPMVLEIPDSPSLQFGTGDFAYLLVMAWSNDPYPQTGYTGVGTILNKTAPLSPYPGLTLVANYPAFFPSAPGYTRLALQCALGENFALSYSDHLNDNQFRVYGVRRKGTDLALRINGVRENGTRVASDFDFSLPGNPLVIGGSSGIPLKGDIAEIVALRGTTSDAELAGLEAYLMDKYALR